MAASCENVVYKLRSAAMAIVWDVNKASTHIGDAQSHWNLGEDHLAIEDLISACYDINMAASRFGGWIPYDDDGPILYYLLNCISGVDMDAINLAMLRAEKDEYKQFIGIVDAYRVALFNQPFNSEFYAALARGFEGWD